MMRVYLWRCLIFLLLVIAKVSVDAALSGGELETVANHFLSRRDAGANSTGPLSRVCFYKRLLKDTAADLHRCMGNKRKLQCRYHQSKKNVTRLAARIREVDREKQNLTDTYQISLGDVRDNLRGCKEQKSLVESQYSSSLRNIETLNNMISGLREQQQRINVSFTSLLTNTTAALYVCKDENLKLEIQYNNSQNIVSGLKLKLTKQEQENEVLNPTLTGVLGNTPAELKTCRERKAELTLLHARSQETIAELGRNVTKLKLENGILEAEATRLRKRVQTEIREKLNLQAKEEALQIANSRFKARLKKCQNFHCPDKWKHHGFSCFFIVKKFLKWQPAEENCRKMGGHLAAIHNYNSQFILDLYKRSKLFKMWQGLKYVDKKWLWTDGSQVDYTNWLSGYPKLMHLKCMALSFDTKCSGWANQWCGVTLPSLCELTCSPADQHL